jgi:putative transposase
MARPHRLVAPGSIVHLGARGAVRQQLFRDDRDRHGFLAELRLVAERFRWSCLSYCLMGNHYHLLIELHDANLSEGMQRLNGKYARVFNDRHLRDGCVFDGRFWSRVVTTDRYFHAAVRYINLNPVEAQFCARPEQWPWSSHRELVGEAPPHRAAVGRTLLLLSAKSSSDHRPYIDLVGMPSSDPLGHIAVRLADLTPAERAAELSRLRRDRGCTMNALAQVLGRSPRTLQRWIKEGATSGSDPIVGGDIGV